METYFGRKPLSTQSSRSLLEGANLWIITRSKPPLTPLTLSSLEDNSRWGWGTFSRAQIMMTVFCANTRSSRGEHGGSFLKLSSSRIWQMPAVPARTLIMNSNVIKNDLRGAGSEDTDTCSASVGARSGMWIKVSLKFSQRRLTFCSEHQIRPQSLTSETETGGNCFATTLCGKRRMKQSITMHQSVSVSTCCARTARN